MIISKLPSNTYRWPTPDGSSPLTWDELVALVNAWNAACAAVPIHKGDPYADNGAFVLRLAHFRAADRAQHLLELTA